MSPSMRYSKRFIPASWLASRINFGGLPRATRRIAAILMLAGASVPVCAQTYTVGGSISTLGASSGLQLRLDSTFQCLADNHYFVISSTDTNDCFTSPNFTKCCSNSIKATSSDGISHVTCTCGVVIIPQPLEIGSVDSTSQTINVPANATTFSFSTALSPGSPYAVHVATQPGAPASVCSTGNNAGTVANANVAGVAVACGNRIFKYGFDPTG